MTNRSIDGPSGLGAAGRGRPERYILSGPAAVLGPLGPLLQRDPTVHVVSGPSRRVAGPDRLIAEMSPGRAAQLATALGGVISVELDAPLAPPDPPLPPAISP